MLETKDINIPDIEIIAKTCDLCKTRYTKEDHAEFNEFIHINKTAGYYSVFGDLERIRLDVCQYCLKKIIDESKGN